MKTIRKLAAPVLPFAGEFSPEQLPQTWQNLEEWEIACYPWSAPDGYRPKACARVGVHEGDLHVLMYALEPAIQARETRVGGAVCVDSCLEFFVQPLESDERYLNFEANPLGTMHLGIGAGRAGRAVFSPLQEGVCPVASEHRGAWWAVYYKIPGSFLEAQFGRPLGERVRANCYTCDESIHPHFGTLFPVNAPKPDFHRPECFQTIAVEI